MKSVVFPQNERISGRGFDAQVTAGVPVSLPDDVADLYVAAGLAVASSAGVAVSSGGGAPAPAAGGGSAGTSSAAAVAAETTRAEAAEAMLLSQIASGGASAVTTGQVVPAGTTQATATPLGFTVNTVLAVAGGGVILLSGMTQLVVVENKDPAAPLPVYPPTSAQVNAVGVNQPVQIAPLTTAIFTPASPTQIYSE